MQWGIGHLIFNEPNSEMTFSVTFSCVSLPRSPNLGKVIAFSNTK